MKTTLTHNLLSMLSKDISNVSNTKGNIVDANNQKENKNSVDVTTLLKDKNIQSTLKDLFNNLLDGAKASKTILSDLKNSSVFKDFTKFSSEIKTLIDMLEKSNTNSNKIEVLKNSLIDMKQLDEKSLKSSLNKTGVFLESYLKNISSGLDDTNSNSKMNKALFSDLKALLLQINEESSKDNSSLQKEIFKQSEKMLAQIDYYQLLSLSNSSNNTYLPFSWDNLEDGNIEFSQENENNFSCHINLELINYGKINMKLLFEKENNLNMAFFVEKEEMKEKLQRNLKDLRIKLNDIGIKLNSLNIFDLISQEQKNKEFNAYTTYNDTGFGIDIRV